MKKLAILFLLIFLFPISVNAKSKKKYLALGDSITYGYTTEDPTNQSYPAIFSKKYNFDLTNEAVVGDRSIDLLEKLSNYNIDDYDVITICIGANDIFKSFTQRIYGKPIDEMIETLNNILTDEEVQKEIEEGFKAFEENLPKIMSILKKGHAQIYMMNVYNPYNKSIIEGLSSISDNYVKKLNEIIDKNKSGTNFINLYKLFNKEKKVINSQSISTKSYDPHPTAKGQEVIASYLIDVYDKNNATLTNIILIIIIGFSVLILEIVEIIYTLKKFTIKMPKNNDIKPKLEDNLEKKSDSSRFIRS